MKSLRIDYDVDYGIDKRTGWSIHWDRLCVVQLEPWFVVAVFKAWRQVRMIKRWRRQDGNSVATPSEVGDPR